MNILGRKKARFKGTKKRNVRKKFDESQAKKPQEGEGNAKKPSIHAY